MRDVIAAVTNSNIRFGDPLRAARYKTFLQRSFLDRLSTNLYNHGQDTRSTVYSVR